MKLKKKTTFTQICVYYLWWVLDGDAGGLSYELFILFSYISIEELVIHILSLY